MSPAPDRRVHEQRIVVVNKIVQDLVKKDGYMFMSPQRPSSEAISVIFSISDVACFTTSAQAPSAHISIFLFIPTMTTFFLIAP